MQLHFSGTFSYEKVPENRGIFSKCFWRNYFLGKSDSSQFRDVMEPLKTHPLFSQEEPWLQGDYSGGACHKHEKQEKLS